MKKLIVNSKELNLSDVVSRISCFVIVKDCRYIDFASIYASDDNSEEDMIASLPDNKLKELSEDTIHSITNVDILDRIAKVCKDKLSAEQLSILKEEYSKKIRLTREDKQDLIDMFKECNQVFVEERHKNMQFIRRLNLDDNDMLSILHSIKLSDFDSKTKSINFSHLGDTLIILHPNILVPYEGKMIGCNLYLKLDIDEADKEAIVYVSIHPRYEKIKNKNSGE